MPSMANKCLPVSVNYNVSLLVASSSFCYPIIYLSYVFGIKLEILIAHHHYSLLSVNYNVSLLVASSSCYYPIMLARYLASNWKF